ncbi:MAG: hypothetical protein II563_02065, partial [Treponema sp.]|nr:hypothetical protein [Treponema sp.]
GSTMTSQISVKKFPLPPFIKGESVSGRRIFSAADAMNWHLSLTQFISALYQASWMASGTISIHNNSFPIHNFKKLIPILPAPQ